MKIKFETGQYFQWKFVPSKVFLHLLYTFKNMLKGNTYGMFFQAGCLADSLKQFKLAYYLFCKARESYDSCAIRINIAILEIIINKDFAKSKYLLESCIEDVKNDAGIIYWLGCIYFELGKKEAASEHFKKIINDRQYGASALSRLGLIYEESGEYSSARQYYLDAIRKDKRNYFAHVGLGRLDLDQGNIMTAKRWLTCANRIWRNGPEAKLLLRNIKQVDVNENG